MSLIPKLFMAVLATLALACGNRSTDDQIHQYYDSSQYTARLVPAGQPLKIPLDDVTVPVTNALQVMGDTLVWMRDSSLLMFSLRERKVIHTIVYPRNNPQRIQKLYHFYLPTRDTALLITNNAFNIYQSDWSGKITHHYSAYTPDEPFFASYQGATAGANMTRVGRNLYYVQVCEPAAHESLVDLMKGKSPLIRLDLSTGQRTAWPPAWKRDYDASTGSEPYPAVGYDGQHLLLSFPSRHALYRQSPGGDDGHEVDASSDYFTRFIDPIEKSDRASGQTWFTKILSGDEYAFITYDPYRHLYYRFMYRGITPVPTDNLKKLSYMRPSFTIIILDQAFHKIGETSMPVNRHVAFNHFVAPEGLYISNHHFLNTQAHEDTLSFTLYKPELGVRDVQPAGLPAASDRAL